MEKVLFVAAEAIPFAKTGGLGEVVGSLPHALKKQKLDVGVMIPKYGLIPEEMKQEMTHLTDFTVNLGWRSQYAGIDYLEYKGIPFYFLDNEFYFKRGGIYGYYDEAERFVFFCRAVLESLPHLDFQPQVLHCHDWHTGMIPLFLKSLYSGNEYYERIKTVFTIHNLKYQGIYTHWILHNLLSLGDEYFNNEKLEYYGQVNLMKGGIVYSDSLTTVSPTYAQEIKYSYYGEGLDGVLNKYDHKLSGILNGIDYDEYNPRTDSYIYSRYYSSPDTKSKNKTKLQEDLQLPVQNNIPLLGMVTRLTEQKGLDLLIHIMEELMGLNVQVVILGTGEHKYENILTDMAGRHSDKLKVLKTFDEVMAHKIYAASDIFLMPSKFEPCGISQMMALRYGTPPIVRETGGLKDTIRNFNMETMEGNGFTFDNYNAHDFLFTIKKALELYDNKEVWSIIVKNALQSDNSWDKSAKDYYMLYKSINEQIFTGADA